VHSCFNNKRVA